jgi:ATP-dependent exoDNAse (exonuclease V) beta subunit
MSLSAESAPPAPADQSERTRFVTELNQNFSVVASAGSGKTRAITDRIAQIASAREARDWLPRLVVVTFTQRAANEMQQRARQKILEAGLSPEIQADFNRSFFGTIHSFCVRLLGQYGHHIGLPGKLGVLSNDDAVWREFVQSHTQIGSDLPRSTVESLLRLISVKELMALARKGGALAALRKQAHAQIPPPPNLDFQEIHQIVPKGRAQKTVERTKERLKEWESQWRADDGFLSLPKSDSKSAEFLAAWNCAFEPLRAWVRACALRLAAGIEKDYRDFRIQRGVLTFNDQVELAGDLLRSEAAATRIRERGFRVILDEAQDTDPEQFNTLLEITRPAQSQGVWLETLMDPPRPGHFCMVGDFQQSIFGERAVLSHYRLIHERLVSGQAGAAVEFSVTFRLDQAPAAFVNRTFARVLDGKHGQVPFVEVRPRPHVLPGQVAVLNADPAPEQPPLQKKQTAPFEAREIARWIRAQGLDGLRARSWREVAILCPRKDWFGHLKRALQDVLLESQIQSEKDTKASSPAYAWFTALLVIMTDPGHGYEIVGVLREIFGISDHDLAVFSQGDGARFQIAELKSAEPTRQTGPVDEALLRLARLREKIEGQPLLSAVETIVAETELHERLRALPTTEFDGLEEELAALISRAATAEAKKQTLGQFAELLLEEISSLRESGPRTRDAIQLITMHKAKGSEWDAVIVPYLSRKIHGASNHYPRILTCPESGDAVIAINRDFIALQHEETIKNKARQEMERLLYVALTRARHTLALTQDLGLYGEKQGAPPSSQSGHLSRGLADGEDFLADLTPSTAPCDVTRAAQELGNSQREAQSEVSRLGDWQKSFPGKARQNAVQWTKRNPSALAHVLVSTSQEPVEGRAAEAKGENAATRYGTWWHKFVEDLPWKAGKAAWDAVFTKAIEVSPDPERSQEEWALLREHLLQDAGIGSLLTRPGVFVRAEMPFLWSMSAGECLEGIMDLVVYDPKTDVWLILDWKTNRIGPEQHRELLDRYKAQLAAYWKAGSALFGKSVQAALYSTRCGAWLSYESDVLLTEWDSLLNQPELIEAALSEANDAL